VFRMRPREAPGDGSDGHVPRPSRPDHRPEPPAPWRNGRGRSTGFLEAQFGGVYADGPGSRSMTRWRQRIGRGQACGSDPGESGDGHAHGAASSTSPRAGVDTLRFSQDVMFPTDARLITAPRAAGAPGQEARDQASPVL